MISSPARHVVCCAPRSRSGFPIHVLLYMLLCRAPHSSLSGGPFLLSVLHNALLQQQLPFVRLWTSLPYCWLSPAAATATRALRLLRGRSAAILLMVPRHRCDLCCALTKSDEGSLGSGTGARYVLIWRNLLDILV